MSAIRGLSRDRNFVLLWVGQVLSDVGSQATTIAMPLLVLSLTGSPAQAGLVGVTRTIAFPLVSLPSGVIADRVDRRGLMIVCALGRLVAIGSIPVAFAFGRSALVQLLLVTLLDAGLFAIGRSLSFVADSASFLTAFLSLLGMRVPARGGAGRRPEVRRALALGAAIPAGRFPALRRGQPDARRSSIVVGVRLVLTPSQLRGRVQASAGVIAGSIAWTGPLAVGLLFQYAGESATVLSLSGWSLAVAGLATASRGLRVVPDLSAAADDA